MAKRLCLILCQCLGASPGAPQGSTQPGLCHSPLLFLPPSHPGAQFQGSPDRRSLPLSWDQIGFSQFDEWKIQIQVAAENVAPSAAEA